MTIQAKTESFWDKLENLGYPAIISLSPDFVITASEPERTKSLFLELTNESYEALLEMVTLAIKLRQHHLWCEAKKAGDPIPDPLVAEEKYRLAAFEVINAMTNFPLVWGTVLFVSEEPCPDVDIITVTEALADPDIDDCVPTE